MTIRKHFLTLLFAILCPVVAQAGDTTETHIAVSGSLPVLLTVPHDGELLSYHSQRVQESGQRAWWWQLCRLLPF